MLININTSGRIKLPSLKSLRAGNKIARILKSQKIVKRKRVNYKKRE